MPPQQKPETRALPQGLADSGSLTVTVVMHYG
jgi:hypothetical protein